MRQNKRIIAVCLTKLQDAGKSEYIDRLHALARENGCKLLIFNSYIDFYNRDASDRGAASVFDVMNFELIDAVVVLYASFLDREIPDRIIQRAKAAGKPVILLHGECEGCWSIQPDFGDAYTQLIHHVIDQHGVRDTFFMAGPVGNEDSERRLACYRRALEMNGLPFEESRVGHGDFWEGPTRDVLRRLTADGKRPPRAIFCANDSMAFAVCDELARQGYRVPDDVVVTGFDGLPASEHFTPRLTTCGESKDGLARLTYRAIDGALADEAPCTLREPFHVLLGESCGCRKLDYCHFRESATNLFNTIDAMESHEEFVLNCVDRMLAITGMNDLYNTIQRCIPGNSCVCLNSDFIAAAVDGAETAERPFTDQLLAIPSGYSVEWIATAGKIALSDMVPDLDNWLYDDTSCIFSAVAVGARPCGYFVMITDWVSGIVHRIKRVAKAVNIACTVAVNLFRQQNMNMRIQRAALTSAVTGMPNLKGAVQWFEDFARDDQNHARPLSFSVYGLPKYRYILDNYGVEAVEEALRIVAETLRTANPTDCFLAQIAEDAFAVINWYDDSDAISGVINKAVSVFFSMLEGYNGYSDKEYYVEVNCGCTVADPGWSGALEGFIRLAYGEMYMNQMKSGMGNVSKEQNVGQKQYHTFSLLMEKNLFHFHFQPIVSARNGEIYGYEALMRTDSLIGMNPLEVLDAARQFNRLDDVERLTLFGIMDRYARDHKSFGARKVFINTIPGHFLKADDRRKLTHCYGPLMDKVVFELTEQDTVSEAELSAIRQLCGDTGVASGATNGAIAIDDYGTGHSNIVNLLRYTPQVIKIDRFLIADIHCSPSKQMFVRSTIEFARQNQIQVLAEGVETAEEMRTVIELGVDLIQGYYTGRPAPEPIAAVRPEVLSEIIRANPAKARPN